ncbi:uncharacterized protein LOC121177236 [Toxotes jaculatrix]|uniref:uncharacterized protein LOC121177236 n=1 Tax=Toxotes jaculatrix TaxID=941984 RepID=UPI001B3AC085|nr:uncharacterized protein LOC121177236 [Toxotes jaculatrix]
MAPAQFVFYLVSLFLWTMAQTTDLSSSVHQETGFISAHVGESVTLHCLYQNDVVAKYYWYKQALGQKPWLISTFYKYDKNGTFYNEFKNNPRFTLDADTGKNHLTISDLRTSDSATYYCVSSFSITFEFAEDLTLSVKDSRLNNQALVYQSSSEAVQPGGSVTLNCTVHIGTCDGEHSVYWIRNSEESHPGLIYSHGDKNDQCERKPDSQTHTCVYNLARNSLNLFRAETYYCAVASCGHLLFGNRTELDFESADEYSLTSLYFLSGAVAFTTTLSVLLAFSVCVISRRKSCHCTESPMRLSDPDRKNVEGYQNEDYLNYNALRVNKINRRGRPKDSTWSECVYFSAKQ